MEAGGTSQNHAYVVVVDHFSAFKKALARPVISFG